MAFCLRDEANKETLLLLQARSDAAPPRQVDLDGDVHRRRDRAAEEPRQRLLQERLAGAVRRSGARRRLPGRADGQGPDGGQVRAEEVLPGPGPSAQERLREGGASGGGEGEAAQLAPLRPQADQAERKRDGVQQEEAGGWQECGDDDDVRRQLRQRGHFHFQQQQQ